MTARLTSELLPAWVTWLRAPNPGPMTLDGTNTWLLDDGTVIDPGPDDPAHLDAIVAAGPVRRILVTHGHHDHVEGVATLAAMTGASVGEAPDWLTVLDTPGHTADSVCFVAERDGRKVVFTGDTILGRGSSVVAWPDGDVGAYLASLDTLTGYPVPGLPGHGPALPNCAVAAAWLRAHRLERLDQVRDAVKQGASTPEDVVDLVYADVDPGIRFAAEWTVRAQLAYLATLSEL
ncbi:MBL fold metallo-hydrolase [Catellatospora methionotrophica]|uniref:MBL fold metallo-hydrolase n=1 Tax=Catellatospora methionotrophica TaxID=121620 RepID=A0A8J3PGI9_9ACTN|nr:MBL fold metallo-hydrolase [Catellatospora methionotrophica]GIG14336.1 MBL fold metallo-hydrolase [Catellatospora methionotrophica]